MSIPSLGSAGAHPHAGDPGAWRKGLVLVAYSLLCLAYFAWVWTDDLTDLGGDSAMYMLMARHLSPFHPVSAVLAEAVKTAAYPPLFPLLIGWCGGSMLAGHLIAVACLLAALPVLFLWLRSEGLAWTGAVWLTAVFALMPGTYLLTLNIWTENPYLLFSLLALLALRRAEAADGGRRRPPWLAAAAVALATLTRAAALPLLGAFAAHLVLRRPPRWPWLLLAGAAPFVLWAATGQSQQSGFTNYLAQWNERYDHDAVRVLLQQVSGESRRPLGAWIQAWLGHAGQSSALQYPVMAVGALCLAGWLRRLAQLRFDALYLALYAALLLAWPFPAEAERLEYVLTPVLLAQGALLLQALGAVLCDAAGRQLLLLAYGGMLSLMVAPSLVLTAQRYFLPAPGGLTLLKHTPEWYGDDRLGAVPQALVMAVNFNALRGIGKYVAPGECVLSIKPSVVTLYTERSSYTPPPAAADGVAFERGIARCRYVYAMALVSPSFREPFYPLGRMAQRGKALLNAAGGDQSLSDTYGLLVDLGAGPSPSATRP